MGDRYFITVICPGCDAKHLDVYYAPTCGITDFTCPKCGCVIDLEEYTGISYEDASNADAIAAIADTIVRGHSEQTSPYVHLTDAERSADARTLHRLLEEARAELEDYTSQAEAGGEQLLDRMLDAQCWSTRWKQAAKEYRDEYHSQLRRAVDYENAAQRTQAETAAECVAIATAHGATDTAAAIRERFKVD